LLYFYQTATARPQEKNQAQTTTMPAGSIRKKARRKYAPPVSGPPKAAVAILVRADGKILCVLPQWAVSKGKVQWEEPERRPV
jgi:hypothetical protein